MVMLSTTSRPSASRDSAFRETDLLVIGVPLEGVDVVDLRVTMTSWSRVQIAR
jgi:hypothetical protein